MKEDSVSLLSLENLSEMTQKQKEKKKKLGADWPCRETAHHFLLPRTSEDPIPVVSKPDSWFLPTPWVPHFFPINYLFHVSQKVSFAWDHRILRAALQEETARGQRPRQEVRESKEVCKALVRRTEGPLPGVLGTRSPTAFLNVPPKFLMPPFNPGKAAPSTADCSSVCPRLDFHHPV